MIFLKCKIRFIYVGFNCKRKKGGQKNVWKFVLLRGGGGGGRRLMAKTILNFHFDYLKPSLSANHYWTQLHCFWLKASLPWQSLTIFSRQLIWKLDDILKTAHWKQFRNILTKMLLQQYLLFAIYLLCDQLVIALNFCNHYGLGWWA